MDVDKNKFNFTPEKIEIEDDAFHGSGVFPFTEWWYFDSTFENGYSIQIGIRIVSLMKVNIAVSRLDVYKDGKLVSNEKKIHFGPDFKTSSQTPLVQLSGKQALIGYVDKKTGKFVYDLSFDMDETSINLRFTNTTNGWKGRVSNFQWGVILPRANVAGEIKLKNKIIKVNGIGYHDHNWNVTPSIAFNMGWFWGKVNSLNNTMIWANILKTKSINYPILVINNINNGYTNINPQHIKIEKKNKGKETKIEKLSSLSLDANNEDLSLQLDMEIIDIHHERVMGFFNYWRYHAKCTGQLIINNEKEKIDEVTMFELFRFK